MSTVTKCNLTELEITTLVEVYTNSRIWEGQSIQYQTPDPKSKTVPNLKERGLVRYTKSNLGHKRIYVVTITRTGRKVVLREYTHQVIHHLIEKHVDMLHPWKRGTIYTAIKYALHKLTPAELPEFLTHKLTFVRTAAQKVIHQSKVQEIVTTSKVGESLVDKLLKLESPEIEKALRKGWQPTIETGVEAWRKELLTLSHEELANRYITDQVLARVDSTRVQFLQGQFKQLAKDFLQGKKSNRIKLSSTQVDRLVYIFHATGSRVGYIAQRIYTPTLNALINKGLVCYHPSVPTRVILTPKGEYICLRDYCHRLIKLAKGSFKWDRPPGYVELVLWQMPLENFPAYLTHEDEELRTLAENILQERTKQKLTK